MKLTTSAVPKAVGPKLRISTPSRSGYGNNDVIEHGTAKRARILVVLCGAV